jgi:hypothetical protein
MTVNSYLAVYRGASASVGPLALGWTWSACMEEKGYKDKREQQRRWLGFGRLRPPQLEVFVFLSSASSHPLDFRSSSRL